MSRVREEDLFGCTCISFLNSSGRSLSATITPEDLQLPDTIGMPLRPEDMELIWSQDRWRDLLGHNVKILNAVPIRGVANYLQDRLGKSLGDISRCSTALVPVTTLPDELVGEPLPKQIRRLANLRRSLIQNYAIDPLTQTSGILEVSDYQTDPVLGDDDTKHTLISPILSGQWLTPHVLGGEETNASAWIQLAKNEGLKQIRILFAS